MNRHILFIVLVSLGSTCGANAAPGLKEIKDEKTELKKLEGDWKIESWVQLGRPVSVTGTWTFKEDKYTFDQGTNVEEGTVKMDRAKKPAVFDLAITAGTCKGQDQLGIYKLDGDTLTLSLAWPGGAERPKDFESTMDNRYIVITLKRSK